MERVAAESLESLARFPEENPYPVMRISREGEILYANAAAEPVIKIFACMVSKKLHGEWKALADDAFADGQLRSTEIGCSEHQVFALTLAPVLGTDYLNVYGLDITERKATERKLQKALAEVQQLKDRLLAENTYLQDEINHDHGFAEIVTHSTAMKQVLAQVDKVSSTSATVLILGESGTGKELLARAVHEHSARRDRSLVKVNCAALPSNLIESELFGHEKGAFTGAVAKKIGRFELADGGTLFLDEIGDLSLDLQAKLLRVLQEGEFERVGNPKTIKVDVRIIAATHRDLQSMAQVGDFREDLFYRLNVFPIHVPALRERPEDVPLLVSHFVKKHGPRLGKHIENVPVAVQETLANYNWPGNVRELENVIERAIILSQGNTLELGDTFARKQRPAAPAQGTAIPAAPGSSITPPSPGNGTLKDMERTLIVQALEATAWRVEGDNGAARRLDMSPSTLRDRMKKYGLKRPRKQAA